MREIKRDELQELINAIPVSNLCAIMPNKASVFFPIEEQELAEADEYGMVMTEPMFKEGRNKLVQAGILVHEDDITLAYVSMEYAYTFNISQFISLVPEAAEKFKAGNDIISKYTALFIRHDYVLTEFNL